MISGLVELNGKPVLVGSVKDGTWKVKAFEFTENGELIRESELGNGVALTAAKMGGKITLGGYKGSDLWVWGRDWEVTLPNGAATSLLPIENGLLVGGEVYGKAVLLKTKNGKILWKREPWERGWVEILGKGVALGVKEEEGKTVMVVERI
ncbi:hypothetical protein [Thermococcus pacificus]|uniref:hypothetical protein n=1 Tax=Thermococcus pacificus TaxID=71998 RepID=UPI001E5338B9|nr:hypothetical protein [Thermococcus pacificus]